MIAKLRLLSICLFISFQLQAQQVPSVEVPDEMEFAGMKLKFTNGAKEVLQKDIVLISKNAKYFQMKVERANLYFPLIEKVFEEEAVPKDFKFLALQESSLVGDAISKSNAVGYWQFKKESGIEVGLRIDKDIDERMNVIASTRGAARYLKRNNQTFNNWIYTLLSYNLGLGGAKSQIDQSNIGAKKMTLDENTHWYVMRFLAHKLIFQHAIGNASTVDSVLVEYINGSNKSFSDIAAENKLDKDIIASYNKWLKTTVIPSDKIYSVVLVVPMSQVAAYTKTTTVVVVDRKEVKLKKEKFPSAADINLEKISSVAYTIIINGAQAVMAKSGDNSVKLANAGNISKEDFLKYNEMRSFDDIIAGRIYYLEKKRNKAMVMFHTVQYNETLWDIAQNYGIKTETIREKNRMDDNEAIEVGRVLWLRSKRPKNKQVEYKKVEQKEVLIKTEKQIIVTDTVIMKSKDLKPTENIFIHYNTSSKPFVADSIKYTYTYHDVASGETLFGISRKYQAPTDSLMKWNNLEGYGIKYGQTLIVASKLKNTEPITITYTVVTGDTFYKIAHHYNVTTDELMLWNNKTDMNLKLGDKLVIKKSQP